MTTTCGGTLIIPSGARNPLSPLNCRGGACPARAQFEASVWVRHAKRKIVNPSDVGQSPKKTVIPSEARNLLFLPSAGDAVNYNDGSGGSAGAAEVFGEVEGFDGVAGLGEFTGLAADAGLLCDGALAIVKYLRIFSRRFGPIPRIARKSSTLLNAPYDLRICKILSAVTGPIPGTNWSSSDVAVFKLMGDGGGFFFAASKYGMAKNAARTSEMRAIDRHAITA
jgi:hypothetical protein